MFLVSTLPETVKICENPQIYLRIVVPRTKANLIQPLLALVAGFSSHLPTLNTLSVGTALVTRYHHRHSSPVHCPY